jgi:hypothetical protein
VKKMARFFDRVINLKKVADSKQTLKNGEKWRKFAQSGQPVDNHCRGQK